jgi:hypothetical protein
MTGELSSLLFLGLEELDLKKLSAKQKDRIMEILKQESSVPFPIGQQWQPQQRRSRSCFVF